MIKRFLVNLSLLILFTATSALGMATQVNQEKVKIFKEPNGAWQLLVNDKPYFIKGVVFTPVKIGEDPGAATMHDWMYYDQNNDGQNDIAFKTWVDRNRNNRRGSDEPLVGDFQLLKELGVNTIRLYHVASDNPVLGDIYKTDPGTALQFNHPVNKVLLRKLYSDYGIRVIMGNFLGSWTIGSGASWDEGTDYKNPTHRENIKRSVRAMVLDNKDEPYVLMWLLGNENNIADWSHCNAKTNPEAYAKLIGELAVMIHQLDPDHPVAVSQGDVGIDANRTMLKLYAQYAPGVDIIAYNSYRGKDGFGGSLWEQNKKYFDRPVFMGEFGTPAYNIKKGEDEDWQDEYIQGCWKDIVKNSPGNSIGGVIYDWVDRWYMDGSPFEHNPGTKPSGSSADGIDHEEWFGIMSMGNGSDWLMRQPRKICNYLKKEWNQTKPSF